MIRRRFVALSLLSMALVLLLNISAAAASGEKTGNAGGCEWTIKHSVGPSLIYIGKYDATGEIAVACPSGTIDCEVKLIIDGSHTTASGSSGTGSCYASRWVSNLWAGTTVAAVGQYWVGGLMYVTEQTDPCTAGQ